MVRRHLDDVSGRGAPSPLRNVAAELLTPAGFAFEGSGATFAVGFGRTFEVALPRLPGGMLDDASGSVIACLASCVLSIKERRAASRLLSGLRPEPRIRGLRPLAARARLTPYPPGTGHSLPRPSGGDASLPLASVGLRRPEGVPRP
jgi:hypothetical protein